MQNNGDVVAVAGHEHTISATTDTLNLSLDIPSDSSPSSEGRWHAAARCKPGLLLLDACLHHMHEN